MKLEYLPEYITIAITSVLGMGLALYLGIWTGGGNTKMPGIFIACAVALLVALTMRAKIWILIPILWPMEGKIAGIPGDIPVRDIAIIYVFFVFLAFKALKVIRSKITLNWLDYLLFANLLYLITVYIRNPVGTLSMGFDLVGGRPYFEVIFAAMAFWVISQVTISPDLSRKMPWLCTYSILLTSVATSIAAYIPSTAPILNKIYSGTKVSGAISELVPVNEDSRIIDIERPGYLCAGGGALIKALYSVFPPFSTLNPLYIGRFLLATLGVLAILKSGFRSAFMFSGIFFMASAYFRHGALSIAKVLMIGVPIIVLLVFVQGNLVELPYSIQRSLSFLPGDWDPQVILNAQGSTEWRIEIWENVLNPANRYIINWWFGDGFGLTRAQLVESLQARSNVQESLTITGDYHSLPLSTVHVVGYCGGILLLILMLGMAFYSWKLIRRAKPTPYFWFSLFIGIPIILDPVFGIFVFGAFKNQIVNCVYGVTMLRLISRSLEQHQLKSSQPPKEKVFPEVDLDRLVQPVRFP